MGYLRQFLVIAIVFSAFVAVYSLEDAKNSSSSSAAKDLIQTSDSEAEARKRRHRFNHLWWYGGMHALSVLVAVKFKLVLIFLAVMGTIFYGYKIYSGSSCATPIISEHSGSILPFTGYSSSIPEISSISSYPGSYPSSDPYSAYSPEPSSAGIEIGSPGPGPYRRSGSSSVSQKRSARDAPTTNFDFTELAFTMLGVDSQECRKRFICEMAVNYRRVPILSHAYQLISKQFFPQYAREVELSSAKSLKECATAYRGCYSPNDPVPEQTSNALTASGEEGDEKKGRSAAVAAEKKGKVKLDQVQRFVVGKNTRE